MAALYCPCEEKYKIWGEFWWMGDERGWWFYDDLPTSVTYTEQLTHCPACGSKLERRDLKLIGTA
jgi:hypothetical protein